MPALREVRCNSVELPHLRTVGENHQKFRKLVGRGTEEVNSVSPTSSDVRLEAERQCDVEPTELASNPILSAPLFDHFLIIE